MKLRHQGRLRRQQYFYMVLTIGIGILIGLLGASEAVPAYPGYTVTLDGQPFLANQKLYRVEKAPMVPLSAFAKTIGAESTWFPESQEVTLYRNNSYMRFKLGTVQAYHNGNPIALSTAPITIDKQIYVPLMPLAKAFDLNYASSDSDILLKTRNTTRVYFINDNYLETQFFPEFAYTLGLPFGWEKLSKNVYGFNDELDDYNLRLGKVDLTTVKAQDLYSYRDLLKTELQKQYGNQLTLKGEGSLTYNKIVVEYLNYQLVQPEGARLYETFLVAKDNQIYTFDASYPATADLKYLSTLYRDVMSTLAFPSRTIQRQHEYYVELSPFLSLGMQLTSSIHSNVEVMETVPFMGSLEHHRKISSLYAIVTKDNQTLSLAIPIADDGSFNTLLHTPFGTGKHNFEIIARPEDGSADQTLMEFSAINLSSRTTRYRIPTKYIRSDSPEIVSLAQSLTTDKQSSYFRAKALFDWVVDNIQPEFGLPSRVLNLNVNPPRQLTQILTDEQATPIEYNLLLAGLLRSLNFEAKVVSAERNAQLSFFVEAYINGRWVVMDPVNAVLAETYPLLTDFEATKVPTPLNQFRTFHYIPQKDYQSLFDAFKEVE